MQPSSQSSPQRWNLLTPKINGKFDFRSACRKIPKTTAFILILTLILGISYMIPIFFSLAWNLIPQSGIYLYKVEFTFSTHRKKSQKKQKPSFYYIKVPITFVTEKRRRLSPRRFSVISHIPLL